MLKKTFLAGLAVFGLAFTDSYAGLSDDDYIEAAWMTTRFFGAQRSGQGPNWVLDGTNNPTSFTNEKYNGKDVSGGWFDCGDHVMFGQTQGYSSYVLAVSFAEFTKGFYDLYTGDYTDYKASKDYTRKGGKPNGVRDLLEELRYEANFWVKAAIDENNFVTVKGNGKQDHNKWVTAGVMTKLGTGDGGEPREIKGNADDAYTPGMAAAMLAVMARIDPDESAREKYLKAAKTAFAYAKKHKGVTNSQEFYESSWWNGVWEDGPFLAATELYRTTKDESYKTEAKKYWDEIDFERNSYTRFSYSDASPLSYILGEFIFGFYPLGDLAGVQSYLDEMYMEQTDSKGIYNKETGGAGKFPTRTPAGGAFLYSLYSKFAKDSSYDEAIEKNVAYLLGDNSNKKSYVVGFTRNGANAPTRPHHRGYYGNEDAGRDVNAAPNPPEKNKLLGGMIAGDFTSGSHSNSTAQWQVNEVCLDLNAPLVGALGYILSKKAPVEKVDSDVEDEEEKKRLEEEERKKKEEEERKKKEEGIVSGRILKTNTFSLIRNTSSITISNANSAPFAVQIFGVSGKLEQELISDGHSLNIGIQNKGLKIIKVSSKNATKTFKVNGI